MGQDASLTTATIRYDELKERYDDSGKHAMSCHHAIMPR
jgi:hypothetical protein